MLDLILKGTTKIKEEINVFDVQFAHGGTNLKCREDLIVIDGSLGNKKAFISLDNSIKNLSLLSVKSSNEFDRINIDVLHNADEIINWITENVEDRNFNLSPKHGENGKGNQNGQSVLYCNRDEAQKLLDEAIGDFTIKKRLFNFDINKNLFVEFFFEGQNPQSQWHGFHVQKNEAKSRIPEIVYAYYKSKYKTKI